MESSAITLLKEAGKQGLLLTELARQLKQSEAMVQKVLESLASQGQVRKVEENHDGKPVIRIFWQGDGEFEWDTLEGCPCFACSDIDQCGAGQPTSPLICVKLDKWIKERLD